MTHEEQSPILIESDQLLSLRVWLIPLLLFLILLAPLLREGIPATAAGALLLYPAMAEKVTSRAFLVNINMFGFWGYKISLCLEILFSVVMLAWAATRFFSASGQVWGRKVAWWVVSLWLVLPFTISLIYQSGWSVPFYIGHLLLGLYFIVPVKSKNPIERWVRQLFGLLFIISSIGNMMRINWPPPLDPYQLFSSAWPDPTHVREWVAVPSSQLGIVPVVLGLLAVMSAWPRREEVMAKRVLILVGIATISTLLTLLGGPILLYLVIATLALLFAAGGLPLLDERYASLPVLLAILTVAALSVYPYLDVAWITPDELPSQPLEAVFGSKEFWLLDIQSQQEGEEMMIEVLWQVTSAPKRDYTAFVHLLNEQGEIIAQADTLLIDQNEITSSNWAVGYLVRQQYQTTSPQTPTQIRLGLYDLESLERLPLTSGGDSVTVPVTAH